MVSQQREDGLTWRCDWAPKPGVTNRLQNPLMSDRGFCC